MMENGESAAAASRHLSATPGEAGHETGIAPPVLDVDPFSLANLENPYPLHETLREAGPVVYLQRYNCYAVARYDVVQEVLKNWEAFSSASGTGLADIKKPGAWRVAGPIVEADPPKHTQVRSVLQRILSPAVIRTWREEFEKEAEALADRVVRQGAFDGVKDFAEEFVFTVFPRALGLKPTENLADKLVLIGELNFNALGPQNDLFYATEKKIGEILPWYNKSFQRDNLLPGGFGEKIFLAGDAGEIDPDIAPGLLHSFLRGGMDTTIAGISTALWLLCENQDQWALLKGAPERARAAFEETIRVESPIQSLYRTTTKETVLAGMRLEADIKVQVFYGAANRDPRRWERPGTFDITRNVIGHVAMGAGIHMCIGQMIARLEAEATLKALVARVKGIELSGQPVRRINNTLRSLERLPLKVVAEE